MKKLLVILGIVAMLGFSGNSLLADPGTGRVTPYKAVEVADPGTGGVTPDSVRSGELLVADPGTGGVTPKLYRLEV